MKRNVNIRTSYVTHVSKAVPYVVHFGQWLPHLVLPSFCTTENYYAAKVFNKDVVSLRVGESISDISDPV